MSEIKKEKLLFYFEKAKQYKDDIKGDYNETYALTDVSFEIKDDTSRQKATMRGVDSTVLDSQRFLSSFIMSSVFSKTGRWATLKSNLDVLKIIHDTDEEGTKIIANEVDKVLENNSESVYHAIDVTNYYTETAKAVMDCIKVGTGIRKIVEQKSTSKPFTYEYQNLDNIFILEDAQGKPNIIFKRYIEKNLQDIQDKFGHITGYKDPQELKNINDLEEKIAIFEVVIGEFDEKTSRTMFYHAVYTEEFEECLAEESLEYNPYTVFRWSVDSSNPWGIGIGRANKHLLQELKNNVAKRAEHRDKIVNPPVNYYGDEKLINRVSLKAGKVNYGGAWNDGNKVAVQPIQTGMTLIPIDQDIADCRERIRKAYIAQPLGDVGDMRNRSATEMDLRIELFRKEFSMTCELINTELLEPTFMNAYYILQSKGLLQEVENEDYVTHSQIHYVNELTRSAGRGDVMNMIDFYNMVGVVLPEEQRSFIFNVGKFVELARDKMRIPLDVVATAEELNENIAEQQKMMAIQMMSQAQGRMGVSAETGLAAKVKEVGEELDDL